MDRKIVTSNSSLIKVICLNDFFCVFAVFCGPNTKKTEEGKGEDFAWARDIVPYIMS